MPDPAARGISLAALTVLELPPLQAVRVAAACGFDFVGLRPVPATSTEPHFPLLPDRQLKRELRAVLAGEGIGVLDIEIVRLLPTMDWAAIARVLDFAAEFSVERLLAADNDPDPVRSHDTLARLAEAGAALGITPHLEFMPWTNTPDLAAARARIVGIANCRLLVDAFHLARSGGSPLDLEPGAPDVGYLQLCDIAGPIPAMDDILREARGDRLFPGEGEIDLPELLARLPGVPISLEVPADRLRDAGIDAESRARMAMAATRKLLAGQSRHG